ncbi:MAG: hypothetical protein M1825_005412 [Sarcosagium campestre]|nr:MAG: hypothetical protein M1825_005412 [Sarcosagium campestre]
MSEFQAVNSTLSEAFPFLGNSQEVTTPTTPKPLNSSTSDGQRYHTINESSPNTPTRSDFGGVSGQRPLPSSPFTHAITSPNSDGETYSNGSLVREHLQYSASSGATLDVEMGDSDEELDCSDSESAGGDNGRHSKKKKGQRFFCTDYPPCTLSFTRKNILAKDRSNVIVPAGFRDLTTYANMLRQYM